MGFLFLGLLIVFLLLVSPILAYRAYVRVRELEKQSKAAGTENVAARLAALEQKVGELNRRLAEAGAAAASRRFLHFPLRFVTGFLLAAILRALTFLPAVL